MFTFCTGYLFGNKVMLECFQSYLAVAMNIIMYDACNRSWIIRVDAVIALRFLREVLDIPRFTPSLDSRTGMQSFHSSGETG